MTTTVQSREDTICVLLAVAENLLLAMDLSQIPEVPPFWPKAMAEARAAIANARAEQEL